MDCQDERRVRRAARHVAEHGGLADGDPDARLERLPGLAWEPELDAEVNHGAVSRPRDLLNRGPERVGASPPREGLLGVRVLGSRDHALRDEGIAAEPEERLEHLLHLLDARVRARLAVRYVLGNPAITAPIPGLVSIPQVDNMARAVMERRQLDSGERAELKQATDQMWAKLPESYCWLKHWEYV